MRIEFLLRPRALHCTPSDTLMTVAQTMRGHQVSALAVLDGQRLVGMISHRDLVHAIADGADPHHAQVAPYSTAVRHAATPTDDTSQVAQRMLENGLDHIPVVSDGAVVNVVPLRHVVAAEPRSVSERPVSTRPGASAPGRGPVLHAPTLRRSATRRDVRCPVRERAGRPTPTVDNSDPTHVGDAGWWLERAPARSG